ncbi:MAG: proton-conducting transporter membrane subunit [Candidatus Omnitrophica bacterium]|nr:proton-conducting transporter membrane subunit [Candidatus Omnitrophota bacterium]MDD5655046.1 proton-conducting transporter membrane subunit [Candidatus Omnitrophota bacterium]
MAPLLILVPFFAAIFLNVPFKALREKSAFGVALALFLGQMLLMIFPKAGLWTFPVATLDKFFHFPLRVDALSTVLLFCIGAVLTATLLLSLRAVPQDERRLNFISVLLLMQAGMNGAVVVVDLFSLYVFLEIVAVSSFILIAFDKHVHAFEAAFKYLVMSVVATALMLLSIALILLVSPDTTFSGISASLQGSPNSLLVTLAVGVFVCAAFIKSGLMPFHGWLPDAYSAAPAPVSVLLAGVVTKTVGIYTLLRIVIFVFGFTLPLKNILLAVGALSALAGALAALAQTDFKRMLAYSSISQMGYIILGLGCGTPLGALGAVFHLFNHAIFKSLLFSNSAAIESRAGIRNIQEMSGLGSRMPWTALTCAVGSLSTAGIPPLAGFWSKFIIIIALWMSGNYTYAVIAILVSLLTLAYFLYLQRNVFFGKAKDTFNKIEEAEFVILLPAIVFSAITFIVGVAFPWVWNTLLLRLPSIFGA